MVTINISLFITIILFLITVFGLVIKYATASTKQKQQCASHEMDIKALKDEQCLLCYGMLGCLDGLKQLGANGRVTETKNRFEKHLNQQAHE